MFVIRTHRFLIFFIAAVVIAVVVITTVSQLFEISAEMERQFLDVFLHVVAFVLFS